jgi:hypothetical protein
MSFYYKSKRKTTPKIDRGYVSDDQTDEFSYPIAGNRNHSENSSFALGARKNTAIVRIWPRRNVPGMKLDIGGMLKEAGPSERMGHALGKSGYYSAAFILQRVLADSLDVDPEEIEIASMVRRLAEENRHVGEIILADRLANGSGFVRELNEKFDAYLELCLTGRSAANIHSPFAEYVISEAHAASCKTVCFRCLQTYYNSVFHGLLDWRMGMMLLRVMHDANYRCGLDLNFDYREFFKMEDTVTEAARLLALSAGDKRPDDRIFIHLPTQTCPIALINVFDGEKVVGIAPGLWERDAHLYEENAELRAWLASFGAENVVWADQFNVLRQAPQVVQALGQ